MCKLRLPEYQGCCFVISLRTGTLIIGFMQVISSVFGIILCSYFAVHLNDEIPEEHDLTKYFVPDIIRKGGVTLIIILGCLWTINLIISILLLLGVILEKPNLFFPFLYLQIIFGILSIGFAVWIQSDSLTSDTDLLSVISELIINAVITVYFLLVVNSYRKKMKGGSTNDVTHV